MAPGRVFRRRLCAADQGFSSLLGERTGLRAVRLPKPWTGARTPPGPPADGEAEDQLLRGSMTAIDERAARPASTSTYTRSATLFGSADRARPSTSCWPTLAVDDLTLLDSTLAETLTNALRGSTIGDHDHDTVQQQLAPTSLGANIEPLRGQV